MRSAFCLTVKLPKAWILTGSSSIKQSAISIFDQAISNLIQYVFQKRRTFLPGKVNLFPDDLDKIGACDGLA
jgi:alpha-D-ribose 1-methylphosphonate 5-triphosphate diphosphatase PhnM